MRTNKGSTKLSSPEGAVRFRHQSTGGADAVASLSFHRHRPLAKKKRIKSNGKKYNIKKATTYGWISYSTLVFTLVCGGFFSLFHIFIGQRDANANGMSMKKKRVRGHNEIINKDDVLSFPKSDESDSTLKNNNWEDAPSSSYPCGSADSLSSFLDTHQNSTDRFSKRNPICPSAAQNHIHITVPFYNLDEFTMQKVFMDSVDKNRNINQDELSKNARKWFEFDKDTVYKEELPEQKEALSHEDMLAKCRTENPSTILSILSNGKPSIQELNVIERLMENYDFPVEV